VGFRRGSSTCRKARSRPATGATAPIRSRPGAHLGILGEQGLLRPPADPARQRACAPAKRLIRKMGGSRSAPLLTLLYALTFARWSRHPVPAARRFQRASFDRGRSRLLSRGYRWFESISLQQTVCLSPAAAFSRCCRESLAVQARISITRVSIPTLPGPMRNRVGSTGSAPTLISTLASPLLGPAGDRHNRAQGVVNHG
jgi:hypothetical protein